MPMFKRPLRPGSCLVVPAFALALSGCSQASRQASSQPGACHVQFSGNISDSVDLPSNCSTVGVSDAGGYVLNLQASSPQITALRVSVPLGPAPAGVVSSEAVTDWSATATSSTNSRCAFSAGTEAVPNGNFTLKLSSVADVADGDGTAHGTLDLLMYVHATPLYDCGIGSTEEVEFTF